MALVLRDVIGGNEVTRILMLLLLMLPVAGCTSGSSSTPPGRQTGRHLADPAYRGKMPMFYADNSSMPHSSLLSRDRIVKSLHIQNNGQIREITNTMSFSQVNSDGATMSYISPSRQVYEVTTAYSGPFTSLGNQYSSGRQTLVIDAQTGTVFETISSGALVKTNAPPYPAPTATPKKTSSPITKCGNVPCY